MSHKHRSPSKAFSPSTTSKSGTGRESSDVAATNRHFFALVEQGDYDRALASLAANGHGSQFPNEKAICLMRLGRFPEAIDTLRKAVLGSNCAWMRDDVPVIYKTNLATALLLGGHPAGCKSILNELDDESLPAVIRIRSVIRDWEKSLSLWQRANWHWLGLEPQNRPVKFDGVIGEFEHSPVSLPRTPFPAKPGPCMKTAV